MAFTRFLCLAALLASAAQAQADSFNPHPATPGHPVPTSFQRERGADNSSDNTPDMVNTTSGPVAPPTLKLAPSNSTVIPAAGTTR